MMTSHQPMPFTLDALRVLDSTPLSMFQRRERFTIPDYEVVCAWSSPVDESSPGCYENQLAKLCQRERLIWLVCEFKGIGQAYVPVSDQWFMQQYQVAPAHLADDYVTGAYQNHQHPFEQIVLGMLSRLAKSLPLPSIQAPPRVMVTPNWRACDGLLRLEPTASKGQEVQIDWPWLPVSQPGQWVMLADANTLTKLALFYRQQDGDWSAQHVSLLAQRQRCLTVSVLSETMSADRDFAKMSPGAVVRLQRSAGTADSYQGVGSGHHGIQRFQVPMEVLLSAQGQCQCSLYGDVVVTQTFTDVPPPPPLSGDLSDQVLERLRFELGSIQLSIADLAAVKAGKVFELGVGHMPYVSIFLDQQRVGRGEIVVMNQQLAVQVIDFQLPD